jgi:hypothetical protein
VARSLDMVHLGAEWLRHRVLGSMLEVGKTVRRQSHLTMHTPLFPPFPRFFVFSFSASAAASEAAALCQHLRKPRLRSRIRTRPMMQGLHISSAASDSARVTHQNWESNEVGRYVDEKRGCCC